MEQPRSEVTVRRAQVRDAGAIGLLLLESLPDNPSARMDIDDLPPDPRSAGQDVVELALSRGDGLLLVEWRDLLVAVAHLRPKDLVRSRHVAVLNLVMHPNARHVNALRPLVDATLAHAGQTGVEKITLDVVEGDPLLSDLVDESAWWIERRRAGASRVDGELMDVVTWGIPVPPVHDGRRPDSGAPSVGRR